MKSGQPDPARCAPTETAPASGGDSVSCGFGGLTERERAVFLMIAAGRSNRETAQALEISERTVEIHRKKVKRKLGLATAAELARYAVENGLMEG